MHCVSEAALIPYSSMAVEELLRACAESNDSAAWEEFVARFQRDISLSIIRTARRWGFSPPEVVDDLVQDTYLKLCADKCRLLYEFAIAHREAINGYVKTVAINVAHDYFKSQQSRKRGGKIVVQANEELEPKAASESLGGQSTMEREILLRQIDSCLQNCTEGPSQERDRTVFWLHYRQGMTAKEIAALPTTGLTVKGVESVILRLKCMIREKIRDLPSGSSTKAE
ncbi:sigma-70 family RNA polymerase sigma factor [Alloacidobacterium dinghuense]|uniref:Sigma-70 family RNA polymerase sigma factor n=1 Tax=Alloacidobacterium dinghuense TaxID=2763107 RepID=A0A7G8BGR7_9BACT|nr:sigma-70 family RNA polymerase sigma factor [Alloacidobacterium dinghuense]QNI31737.1 sigma-70 family RNA polymerase sigma factor [Alloacidobacterium dinghuense]